MATSSIENEISKEVDFENIFELASFKARKVKLFFKSSVFSINKTFKPNMML